MAGGKETQRQKMIGLMYLVLLALLALQVSSAIIQKFQFLNQSLENANKNTIERNENTLVGIKTSVEKRGSGQNDIAVLTKAEQVRKETASIMSYLEGLKEQMIKDTGGEEAETGNYVGAKEETKIEIMMVGGKKNGYAYAMKEKLNGYTDFVCIFHPIHF